MNRLIVPPVGEVAMFHIMQNAEYLRRSAAEAEQIAQEFAKSTEPMSVVHQHRWVNMAAVLKSQAVAAELQTKGQL